MKMKKWRCSCGRGLLPHRCCCGFGTVLRFLVTACCVVLVVLSACGRMAAVMYWGMCCDINLWLALSPILAGVYITAALGCLGHFIRGCVAYGQAYLPSALQQGWQTAQPRPWPVLPCVKLLLTRGHHFLQRTITPLGLCHCIWLLTCQLLLLHLHNCRQHPDLWLCPNGANESYCCAAGLVVWLQPLLLAPAVAGIISLACGLNLEPTHLKICYHLYVTKHVS